MAEVLLGRGDLIGGGRVVAAPDLPSTAFFASRSASLSPLTLLWLEIQLMDRLGLNLMSVKYEKN